MTLLDTFLQSNYLSLDLLPESVVSSTTLIAFKKYLNKFDLLTICSFVYWSQYCFNLKAHLISVAYWF